MGSSTTSGLKWSHDVFLSFRGEDTRSNFTSHLDMALRQNGIDIFIDDKLKRGEQISETLFKTIQEALISIVIFSQNYASSSWCLDELVKIMECKKSKGQIVLPIFYKVDPSNIRHQTGSFGKALAIHQAKFNPKTQIWREALTTAANLSGWDVGTYRTEAELIRELVKKVSSILNCNCTPLSVAKYPVGIHSQLEDMNLHSHEYESDIGVYMVGIYGIGGLGKTTLAKALYNKIATQFEGCCYLENVRREASKHGLVQLQENLLYQILKDDLKVVSVPGGMNIIKKRLCSKKVLIFLDGVDELDQLEALVGDRNWFGQGSKIIVTTRNKQLLTSHGFDKKHMPKGLNEDKALELFCWHAFKKSHPSSNYLDLSKRATNYCKGLPLALVILGSSLCGRDQAQWRTILDKFEKSLEKEIKNILKLSYDGLEDNEKDIFLDISCFCVGEEVDCAKKILNAISIDLDFGIIKLMDLSLITVENGKVEMHELIQKMGHKIVYDESSYQPEKMSRMWLMQDILSVFTSNSGTDAIKAIKLEFPNPTRLDVDPQAFRNMKNLRLLIFRNVRFSTKIEYLPHSLKWIKWHGFAQPFLPSPFIMKNLVGLDLQHSFIKNFGKRLKVGEWLKHVDLSDSTSLKKISDFSAASNLEELYLENCTNLRTIHKSIFSLVKLTILNLHGCSNLKKLPKSCFMLWSLKYLYLSNCTKLEKIPDFSSASNLKYLYLRECTNLRTINKSVFSLDKLISLDLYGCSNLKKFPTSCFMLESLEDLNLSYCKKLEEIPDFSFASKLKRLYLEECTNLKMIHESIGSLDKLVTLVFRGCTNLAKLPSALRSKSLRYLNLSWCPKLESFPIIDENMKSLWFLDLSFSAIKELPSSIGYLTALSRLNLGNCASLVSLPDTIYSLTSLTNLELRNCKSLHEIPNLPQNIQNLEASGCESLARSPDNIVEIVSKKQDLTLGEISREFILMNTGIPEWFSYKTKTNLMSASFRHYPDMERSLAACVSFKVNGDSSQRGAQISCTIFICNKFHCSFSRPFLPSESEYMWLVTTSLAWGSLEVEHWNKVLVWFEVLEEDYGVNISIKSYGVHVTEELQTDLKWPVVNYSDFYQPEKLQNLDIEDLLLKDSFQEISCVSNSQAMLHAASYDPQTIDSKIQPMIFPLHVTYNGDTVICGMEGMENTALANSLRNKLGYWIEFLDDSRSFNFLQGRKSRRLLSKGGKRGTNIKSHTISSKRYYITFQNLDVGESRDVSKWVETHRWIQFDFSRYEPVGGRKYHSLITRVDPSLWHPREAQPRSTQNHIYSLQFWEFRIKMAELMDGGEFEIY